MRRILTIVFCMLVAGELFVAQASKVRESDEQVLTNSGIELTPQAVTAALEHKNGFVRRSAATLLGTWRTKAAIPNLKAALDDEAPFVRLAAAGALLRMGDKSGVPELVKMLSAPEVGFAVTAAGHLLDASDTQGFDALKTRLASGKIAPLDRLLIERFFASAMRVPSLRDEAEGLVIKALLEDDDRYVRVAAAEDLARYRSPAIVSAFEKIAKDEQDPLLVQQARDYLKRNRV